MTNLEENFTALQTYVPACLKKHEVDGWRIEYYALNPITNKLERKRIRLNQLRQRFRNTAEFRTQANQMVCALNVKLFNGWTPFGGKEHARHYTLLSEVMEKYINEKSKELKDSTLVSYRSFNNILMRWLKSRKMDEMQAIQFSHEIAIEFLDYIYNDYTYAAVKKDENGKKMRKPRTERQRAALPDEVRTEQKTISINCYNNYVKQGRALFTWAVNKNYLVENPFDKIELKKKNKEEEKFRTLVTPQQRDMIREYFLEHNPNFLVVAELVFNALIRPVEITRIRVGQVDLKNKVIHMSGAQTKTGYKRDAVLTDELIMLLADMLAPGYPADYFLIGPGYKPAPKAITSKAYRKTWQKMRETLGLPDSIQLYSLRDTGIVGLFDNGADANTVKGAADHHNLNITSIYCDHVDEKLVEKVREYTPTF